MITTKTEFDFPSYFTEEDRLLFSNAFEKIMVNLKEPTTPIGKNNETNLNVTIVIKNGINRKECDRFISLLKDPNFKFKIRKKCEPKKDGNGLDTLYSFEQKQLIRAEYRTYERIVDPDSLVFEDELELNMLIGAFECNVI